MAPLRSRGSLAALARADIQLSPWPLADGVASCHEIVIIEHPMMIEICPDWRVS